MSGRMGHALCAALLLAGGTAGAAGFWETLDRAIRLQYEENFEEAIAAYQQAQIERPEAEIVYYGLGSTHYQQGAALESSGAPGALEAFQHAAAAFDKLENATDPDLRREAAYGAASARARAARLADPAAGQNPARELRSAIENLETFLEQYPEHDAARHNLDSVRMQLKQILQEPPPPPQPEQQSGDENEDEGEEEQQEQEQSRGQQGDEQDQQESQDGEEPDAGSQPEPSPEEEQEDQEPEGEQPPSPQPEEEQGEEEQDASAAADAREEEQEQQMSAGDQDDRKDMPNIEAILQSLEDMDRREQREQRTGSGGPEVRGAWW